MSASKAILWSSFFSVAGLLISGCGSESPPAQASKIDPYEIVELKPGIYAAIANLGGTGIGNAGIFDMGSTTIVYDTGLTPEAGTQLKEFAASNIGKEVTFVINSHFHDDHIGGNQVFEGASIVSTTETQTAVRNADFERTPEFIAQATASLDQIRRGIASEEDDRVKREMMFMSGYLGGIVSSSEEFYRVVPTLVWDHRLNFTDSLRQIKIIPIGHGHANGESPLWIEADSVLFAADLVTTDRHPRMQDGNYDGWMAALDTLLTLEFDVLVPGHGPLGDRESVVRMQDYLQSVDRAAQEVLDGTPLFQIKVDPAFEDWLLRSQFEENIRFRTLEKQQ